MYWFVSFPSGPTDEEKTSRWNELISKTQPIVSAPITRLTIPKLKVGTLDSLLALSDDMSKFNVFIESTVTKLRRQFQELSRLEGSGTEGLNIDGESVKDYLEGFTWEEAKYPSNRPLRETVEKIQETVGRIDDDLKIKVGEYNHVKGALSAIARKTQGTLAVKDLSGIVKAEHVVESEYLRTLVVVISKFSMKEWLSTYEKLTNYVVMSLEQVSFVPGDVLPQVPRSSKVIAEDHEYALVSVVLFEKDIDSFKTAGRARGFQVRDFKFEAEESEAQKENLEATKADADNKRRVLEEWCRTSYTEIFSAWIHIMVIRLFVESILRYGLPPSFVSGMIETRPKIEKKLRSVLQAFGDDVWSALDEGDAAAAGPSTVEGETLPYVCYSMDPEA